MRILGIDPGISKTGYGLIEQLSNRISLVTSGDITPKPKTSIPEKLKEIFITVSGLIEAYRPDAIAVENSFLHKNVQTAIKLGQARGAVLIAGEISSIPVVEYTPREVKQAVVGYGGAEKEQTQWMLGKILGQGLVPDSHHAADALAVAICHLHSVKINGLIRASLR